VPVSEYLTRHVLKIRLRKPSWPACGQQSFALQKSCRSSKILALALDREAHFCSTTGQINSIGINRAKPMKFYELGIGAAFTFHGRRFEKTCMSMAKGPDGCGHIFMGVTEILTEGTPLLLSPEEAARWKPDEKYWADYLTPAPGQAGNPQEPSQSF
jgi:hypothetical protein